MAWNSRETKAVDLGGYGRAKDARVPLGSPIASNPSLIGRGYTDGWDIERAYREGMQKITWVARAIDAIAGNQARLPVVLRKDNSPDGEVIRSKDNNGLLDVLNSKSNMGENSFVFRHRLSAQLMMSSRGAFIEKVRTRNGEIGALNLLPPQHTSPIPHPRTFVSGYEVKMPNGGITILRPEDVIWVRRPHPLDPYLSLTPMEAAGIAIEVENLAKLYNRNFLLNDGRPGGLLVVRGDMEDDDKEELRSRFRGNLNRVGATTVIASEDGVDFVDTSASPRDASYVEMRQITKEEILAAFGVPETVIGNASGRTFSNASEEMRVFWMETMIPHLGMLARALDELDPDYYIDFDTSEVPILIIAKQERERYLKDEFQMGLISANEYRKGSGRKTVKSELADSLLANPNLAPIANTEKEFIPESPAGAPGAPAAPGSPAAPGQPGQAPAASPPMGSPAEDPFAETPAEPVPANQSSAQGGEIHVKSDQPDEWDVKAEQASDRWTEILTLSLERVFERQQRVVLEKALGAKGRKALAAGTLSTAAIFDLAVWNKQLQEDIRPVLAAIATEGAMSVDALTGQKSDLTDPAAQAYLDEQMARVEQANETTQEEVAAAVLTSLAMIGSGDSEEESHLLLKMAIVAVFAHLLQKRKQDIAGHEAQTAYNFGVHYAAQNSGEIGTKTWKTRRDPRVRAAHAHLEGKTVPVFGSFVTDGAILRFPGDPSAPPSMTANCRCRLKFNRTNTDIDPA